MVDHAQDIGRAARRAPRLRRPTEAPEDGPPPRVAASRARTTAACREGVEALGAAGARHDVTHATLRRVALGTDVLTVHGSGWDLGRYVLWPDGTLQEVAERFGWVDEVTGDVRLRSDGAFRLAPTGGPPATGGGVWSRCVAVPHVDVGAVGERTGVVVADDGVSRWADHPHPSAGSRRRRGAPRARSVADWPDLTTDLHERVRRRVAAARTGRVGG